MKNEIITTAINEAFYVLCTGISLVKDMHYGAITEAIAIAFEQSVITVDELRYLSDAAREVYLSH